MNPRSLISSATAALLLACCATSVSAQAITDPTKPPSATLPTPASAAQPNQPATSPLTLTAAYTGDLLDNTSGGAATGSGYVHLIKLSAAYDGSSSGHDGLSGLLSIVDLSGSHFTARRVGSIQSTSANETDYATLRPYEAWLQQEILGGRGAVKAGLIDINTTFDVQETAALLLNASHGIGPDLGGTGLNGPSDFPTPSLGVTGYYRPRDGWAVQIGVFDGVAGNPAHRSEFFTLKLNGALLVGQVEKRFGDTARVEFGAWTYTGTFTSLDHFDAVGTARRTGGNGGAFALIEGRLLPKPGDKDGGLNGWARAGFANGDLNQVQNYLGGGLVYTGPFEGRDKDEVGVAIARAGIGNGGRYVGGQLGRSIGHSETSIEATYRYAVNEVFNLQPDLQYVIEPRGDRNIKNVLVIGLRFAITYTRQ